MVQLAARGISVEIDLAVGHIADLTIEAGGRVLRPLHRAPWIDEPDGAFPEGVAPNVRRLSGDFLCAPFGRSDIEPAPPHGWPANSAWDLVSNAPTDDGWRAQFRLQRTVMGATIDKVLTLRDCHPFLYQEHVLTGGAGALPVAHHAMTAMRNGGRLAFSAKRYAVTPGDALEPDPLCGRSRLAYPARSENLARFPLGDGSVADLTEYTAGTRNEDFVTLVEAADDGLGWTAVARQAESDLVLVLKDPRDLPVTMLWISNGGRDYAPWSGRHVGVLGVEDGRSAVGHSASISDNPLKREGIATAFDLGGRVSFRQVIGAMPVDKAGVPPTSVAATRDGLRLDFPDGQGTVLPFDGGFLAKRD